LILLLLLFIVFAAWFPVWMAWPNSFVAKALTLTFAIVLGVIGLTSRWFAFAVDLFIKRRGWPLR
jgi:hypothetical protein